MNDNGFIFRESWIYVSDFQNLVLLEYSVRYFLLLWGAVNNPVIFLNGRNSSNKQILGRSSYIRSHLSRILFERSNYDLYISFATICLLFQNRSHSRWFPRRPIRLAVVFVPILIYLEDHLSRLTLFQVIQNRVLDFLRFSFKTDSFLEIFCVRYTVT